MLALCTAASTTQAQDFFVMGGGGSVYRAAIGNIEVEHVGATGFGNTTRSLAFDSKLRLLTVGATLNGTIAEVDTETGLGTPIINPSDDIDGLVFVHGLGRSSESGVLLVSVAELILNRANAVARYNEDTGAYLGHLFLDPLPDGATLSLKGLVTRNDGVLVGITSCADLVAIDMETGTTDYIFDSSIDCLEPNYPHRIGLSSHRGIAYTAINHAGMFTEDQDRVEILSIDLYTGATISLGIWDVPEPVLGLEIVPESLADPATPYGTIDTFDVLSFVASFADEESAADLALPHGVFDYDDVIGFLRAFQRGYP